MPQDQSLKRIALANRLVADCAAIYNGINDMVEASNEYTTAGLTFIDQDFNTIGIQHLTVSLATTMLGDATAVQAALTTWMALLAEIKP